MRKFTMVIVAMFLCLSIGTMASAKGKKHEKMDPAARFDKLDTNSDGKLTLDELKAGLKGKAVDHADKIFAKMDANSDGSVSKDEYVAFEQAHAGHHKKKNA